MVLCVYGCCAARFLKELLFSPSPFYIYIIIIQESHRAAGRAASEQEREKKFELVALLLCIFCAPTVR